MLPGLKRSFDKEEITVNRELRPHQVEAMDLLRQSIASGHKRPIIQAPTGFGKTLVAAAVIDGALSKGNNVLFTCPAISLIDQTVEMLWDEGIREVGVIQANHHLTDWSRPVQVASVQTLMRRPLPDAMVGIVDECHKWFDWYETWFNDPNWASKKIIGLSATPWTKGLGKHYDDLIIASTTQELIAGGYLSNFRVFAPSHPDLSEVRTISSGDYNETDLSKAMDQNPLVADVVKTWLAKAEDRPTLVFAVDCAHAQNLQKNFEEAGISTGYIDAYTSSDDRAAVKKKFHDGTIRVVCNVGCLTTGVDWDVRCISLCRPTKSEMLFVQIIGRGLRTANGKKDCLILDHSDTHLRLGFVTDIQHDELNDGRVRQKAPPKSKLPKECPKCAYLKPPGTRGPCPNCGFKPEPVCSIVHGAGELQELNGDDRLKINGPKPRKKPSDLWTPAECAQFFAELRTHAADRGFKPGWAAMQYKTRFNKWPERSWEHSSPATFVSADTHSYIRSQMIRWAKSKRRAEAHA